MGRENVWGDVWGLGFGKMVADVETNDNENSTNTGSPASKGVKTLHFSVRQDGKRGLNLTHEYLVSFGPSFLPLLFSYISAPALCSLSMAFA